MSFEILAPGYWGVPTASVDWCERNYAHSTYICELFNTVSSLAMLVVGLMGVFWHRRILELRFLWVFASVALVGVGSMAFHATLLRELQMLDELPMLYTAALLVYILVEDQAKPRFGWWLPMGLLVYAIGATYGAAFMRGTVQFWSFQVSFASLEFYGLYRVYLLYRASSDRVLRAVYRRGIAMYLTAILLWFVDLRYCAGVVALTGALGVPNPELHAWWHILVSYGLYAQVLVMACSRCRMLGLEPRWVSSYGLPRLELARASNPN